MKKILASILALGMVFEMGVLPVSMALEQEDTSMLEGILSQIEGEEERDSVPFMDEIYEPFFPDEPFLEEGMSPHDMEEYANNVATFSSSEKSGTCGDNLEWQYFETTGLLIISGKGAMTSYTYNTSTPWYNYSSNIISVSIQDGVTSIGSHAFDSLVNLSSVLISDSVTSIGNWAFKNCSSLSSLPLPNSVKSIGYGSLYGCSSLTSLLIPNSVTSIGMWALTYCSSLSSITIPSSVTSIGEYAFAYCTSLNNISVDSSNSEYTSVGGNLFNKDKTILMQYAIGKTSNHYTVPSSVTSIGSRAFTDCSNLTSVSIPNSVTTLGAWLFDGCSNLTTIEIPNSITRINMYEFRDCSSLATIIIPNSVTVIEAYAFSGCSSLTDIYYNCSQEEWESITIGSNNEPLETATIHYNYNSGENYYQQVYFLDELQINVKKVVLSQIYMNHTDNYLIHDSAVTTNWVSYVGKYVVIDYDTYLPSGITEITPVDTSNIGIVSSVSSDSISINGETYPHSFSYAPSSNSVILYHILDGAMVNFVYLEQMTGTLKSATPSEIVVGFTQGTNEYTTTYTIDADNLAQFGDLTSSVDKTFTFLTDGYNAYVTQYLAQSRLTKTGLVSEITSTTVTIDGTTYNLDCEAAGITSGRRIFCLVQDNSILHIDLIENIDLEISWITDVTDDFVYENSKFSPNSTTLSVKISYSANYDFPSSSSGYDMNIILSDIFFTDLKSLSLTEIGITSRDNKFIVSSSTISAPQSTITLGETISVSSVTLSPASSYVPTKSEETAQFELKLEGTTPSSLPTTHSSKYFSVSVIYQEMYDEEEAEREQAEQDKLEQEALDKEATQLAQELNEAINTLANPTMMLGGLETLMDNADEKKKLKNLLELWVGAIATKPKVTYYEELLSEIYPQTFESIWETDYFDFDTEKTGFDFKEFEFTILEVKSELDVQVTINGNPEIITFYYDGIVVGVGEGDFGTFAPINWVINYSNSNEVDTGVGLSVSTDTGVFFEEVYDIAEREIKNAYDEVFGNSLNESLSNLCKTEVSTIVQTILNKLDLDSPSDYLWNLIVGPTNYYKKTTINCPVDVYVYNQNAEQVGTIINNEASSVTDTNITLEVDGDSKMVSYNGEYSLILLGNDTGTMEYIVDELTIDGDIFRTVTFREVPLELSLEYTTKIPEEKYSDVNDYNLISKEGVIEPNLDVFKATIPEINEIFLPVVEQFSINLINDTLEAEAEFSSLNGTISSAYVIFATNEGYIERDLEKNGNLWNGSYELPETMKNTTLLSITVATDEIGKQVASDIITLYPTITFDSNGGSSVDSTITDGNGKLSFLPTPTRTGYTFNGWFTASTGGTKISTSTVFTENTTIYAQWTKNSTDNGGNDSNDDDNTNDDDTGSSGGSSSGSGNSSSGSSSTTTSTTTYTNTLPTSNNGTITMTPTNPKSGDTVALEIVPNDGYEVNKVIVTRTSTGAEIEVTLNDDGTYSFTQPSGTVTIEVIYKEKESASTTIIDLPTIKDMTTSTFMDMTNASIWYYEPVTFVYDRGLMAGTSATTFSPNLPTDRGMFVTILYSLAGKPEVPSANYTDVLPTDYFADAVAWASSVGVATGTGNNQFSPDKDMTREEMMVMLYAYEQVMGDGGFTGTWAFPLDFTDSNDISDWAYEATAWCSMKGIISGKGEKLLDPKGSAKRCEVAQILKNFVELYS